MVNKHEGTTSMTDVKRTFFITKDEAEALSQSIDYSMPQYELEDGRVLYARIVGADIMTYHGYAELDEIIAYREWLTGSHIYGVSA
jgi:hypothetical protein